MDELSGRDNPTWMTPGQRTWVADIYQQEVDLQKRLQAVLSATAAELGLTGEPDPEIARRLNSLTVELSHAFTSHVFNRMAFASDTAA